MIYLVGMGPGDPEYITGKARRIIREADRIYAYPHHLEMMEIPAEKGESIQGRLAGLPEKLAGMDENLELAVLVSGDPLVFSLSRRFTTAIPPEKWRIIPGIGSAQVFSASLGLQSPLPRQISLHGREMENILPALEEKEAMILYTDEKNSPAAVALYITERKRTGWQMVIGCNISREDEEILKTTPEELLKMPSREKWGLNLVYLVYGNEMPLL